VAGAGGAAGGVGPAPVSVNDLLLSWIAAQKVADNVARVEREAHTLHQKLEETLMRMQGMEVTSATDDGPDSGGDGGTDWPTTTEGTFTTPRLLIDTDADIEDAAAAAAATAALLASPIPATPGSPSALLSLPPSAGGPSLPQTRAAALQARRANVNALRQKLDADMVALSQQRATVLAQRQALQPKLALLQSAHATELSHRESLERGARKHLSELRLQLHLTQLRQSFRRRTLLHHLSQIYPIAPPRTALKSSQSQHPLMCFTIRGLRLPNNFNNILTSFEEEQVSTALGYAASGPFVPQPPALCNSCQKQNAKYKCPKCDTGSGDNTCTCTQARGQCARQPRRALHASISFAPVNPCICDSQLLFPRVCQCA
jgi:hypothetical protein